MVKEDGMHTFLKTKEIMKNIPAVEIIVGYAALILVNFFFFRSNLGFVDVNPHPYWIIILPLAARYGFRAGLWSGLAGGVLEFALSQGRGFQEGVFGNLELGVAKDLILFVCVGLLIGEIREVQKRTYLDLKSRYEEVKESLATLKTHYTALVQAKQELDTSVISQEQTLSTLFEAAKGLRSLKIEAIYPAVLALLEKYVAVQAASLYVLRDGELVLTAAMGDGAAARPDRTPPDRGMMGLAVGSRRLTSINKLRLEGTGEEVLQEGILVSVPILETGGKVSGVINIERMPFVKFNPLALRMIAIIAEWAGTAIENALVYSDAKAKSISDELTGAYSSAYLLQRLTEEVQRSRRYNLPLSLIAIEMVGFAQFSEQTKYDLMVVFSKLVSSIIRGVDLFFQGDTPGYYLLILPNTDLGGARILVGKLLTEITSFMFRVSEQDELLQIRYGLTTVHDRQTGPAELIREVLESMQLYEANNP